MNSKSGNPHRAKTRLDKFICKFGRRVGFYRTEHRACMKSVPRMLLLPKNARISLHAVEGNLRTRQDFSIRKVFISACFLLYSLGIKFNAHYPCVPNKVKHPSIGFVSLLLWIYVNLSSRARSGRQKALEAEVTEDHFIFHVGSCPLLKLAAITCFDEHAPHVLTSLRLIGAS